jgi:CPA2 family monovalent cation:H+ antiporter-2
LVIAIDDKEAITELARHIAEYHPHVHVVARAVDRWHVYDLWSVGCRDIIRETYDSSIRAARSTFEALGFERDKAQRLTAVFEDFDRHSMRELAEVYDINDPDSNLSEYARDVRENMGDWEAELKEKMKAVIKA